MTVIKWSDGNFTRNGEYVERSLLTKAECAKLDRLAAMQKTSKKSKRRSTTRRSSCGRKQGSRRKVSAAEALASIQARAMGELVKRVNAPEAETE